MFSLGHLLGGLTQSVRLATLLDRGELDETAHEQVRDLVAVALESAEASAAAARRSLERADIAEAQLGAATVDLDQVRDAIHGLRRGPAPDPDAIGDVMADVRRLRDDLLRG